MESATTPQALAVTRRWLEPAIHVLLRSGVPWKEFAELAKAVYVEVATEQFGKRGRPTNVSRTAVLTGLTRREVRKQRERHAATDSSPTSHVTKASLILSAWHLDPEFVDKKGRPRPLPVEGERASFTTLIKRCGGADVQPTTLLKELISAGCVRRRTDGRLQVLQRDYIPHAMDAEMLRFWGTALADVARTGAHNLTRKQRDATRFSRWAVNDRMPVELAKDFRDLMEQEGQALLERIDAWLAARQVDITATGDSTPVEVTRLGAGMYQIQD
jgi:hypothetical protein